MARFTAAAFALLLLVPHIALAQDRLPDGGIATASGRGAVEAWYAQPTTRYDHGILGDRIEAGSLVAVDDRGRRDELVLPPQFVFEDITPRLFDLDGDGANEIIVIRTDIGRGAAVAVYDMTDGRLRERAAIPPIGISHRWLSIAGIADFTGNGTLEIAVITTPHIGGILEIFAFTGTGLVSLYPPQTGVSSHFIGSRETSIAATFDVSGDGIADLIVPDQSRRQLVALSLVNGIRTVFVAPLTAPAIGPPRLGPGTIEVPLESGATQHLRFAP